MPKHFTLAFLLALIFPLLAAAEELKQTYSNGKWDITNATVDLVRSSDFIFSKFTKDLVAVKKKGKWGFIDKAGTLVIPCTFADAKNFSDGLAAVKQNGKWGFIDKAGTLVIPCAFADAKNFSNGLSQVKQNGNWRYIDTQGNLYKTRKEFEQLLSKPFDVYISQALKNQSLNNLQPPTDEEIRQQVEAEIAKWQKKGEFEPTAQWQQRVNEQTRQNKAKEIAGRIIGDYNSRLAAAKAEYQREYEKAVKAYCDHYSEKFAKQNLTLRPYDPDNQTFLISTETYGDILLPVPLAEAPAFKSGWEKTKASVAAEFVPTGDGIAIKSIRFGKYVYDSNTKANYDMVDIDYNFKPIDVAALDYNFDAIADSGAAVAMTTATTPAAKTVGPRTYRPEQKKVTAGSSSDVDVNIPEGSAKAPNTFAVIIANGNYAHASKVENAENDGRTMEKYLSRALGIPDRNITTCINATYGQMASAINHLNDIGEAYGDGNFNVLFYYVGHGLPDDDNREAYILPVDVDPKDTEICYPLEKLYGQLGGLGAKTVTVMVDACFSGANHGDGMLIPQSMGVVIKPKASSPRGNMIVLAAADGDETAFPYKAKGHGLFTYWLLKKLQETKGNVTLGELSEYVTDKVRKTSVVENRKPQTPTVATSPALSASWRTLPFAR